MAAIPRTKKEQEEYDKKIASSQAADAARKVAIAERNAEDKKILKDYKGVQVGGAAAGNKADFVQGVRQQTAAAETAKRIAETGASAMSQVGSSIGELGQSANTLATQGESAVGIAALNDFEGAVDYDAEFDQAETFNEGQITDDQRDTMNATQGFKELGGLLADIQKERGYELKSPEAPKDFESAQKDFNEKFGGSMGRAMEGETGDQYEARLKQRNVDRKEALGELAKLKPQDAAPAVADAAGPENTVLKPMGAITGTSFGDTTLDQQMKPREFMSPPASPQASSSARATADLPRGEELTRQRQQFALTLEEGMKGSNNYTLPKDARNAAKRLGIGQKELNNFSKRLERESENPNLRSRRTGLVSGGKSGRDAGRLNTLIKQGNKNQFGAIREDDRDRRNKFGA